MGSASLGGAAQMLALCAVGWLALQTVDASAQQAERIPRTMVRLVNERIQGTIAVRAMGFDFPNRVTFEDVELRDSDGTLIARAAHVDARPDLGALATGDLVVDQVNVVAGFLDVRQEENTLNILRALLPNCLLYTSDAADE